MLHVQLVLLWDPESTVTCVCSRKHCIWEHLIQKKPKKTHLYCVLPQFLANKWFKNKWHCVTVTESWKQSAIKRLFIAENMAGCHNNLVPHMVKTVNFWNFWCPNVPIFNIAPGLLKNKTVQKCSIPQFWIWIIYHFTPEPGCGGTKRSLSHLPWGERLGTPWTSHHLITSLITIHHSTV